MINFVVSDSHGWVSNLRHVYHKALKYGAGAFIHLGDDYNDMNFVIDDKIEVIQVPGTRDWQYRETYIHNRIIRVFEGWRFLISHTKTVTSDDMNGDINPLITMASRNADVLLHGHTHKPEIVKEKGFIRINPGNLNTNDGRESRQTYCVIEVTKTHLKASIHLLNDDSVLLSKKFNR